MSRRSYERTEKSDDEYKYRRDKKRSDRSRSPPASSHSSYGITNESYQKKKQSSSSSGKSNRFLPDEETKKFYDKSTDQQTGYWTSEDYTFRDMLAKDVRNEIEDDIASKGSDDESEEDPEIAEYADRADMDDDDDEQKKSISERIIPTKNDEEKKKDVKSNQILDK